MNSFGGRKNTVGGLSDLNYERYTKPKYQSFQKLENGNFVIQGMLRLSSNFEETNVYFVEMNGKPAVKFEVTYKDIQKFEMPYHCGKIVRITGKLKSADGLQIMTKPQSMKEV